MATASRYHVNLFQWKADSYITLSTDENQCPVGQGRQKHGQKHTLAADCPQEDFPPSQLMDKEFVADSKSIAYSQNRYKKRRRAGNRHRHDSQKTKDVSRKTQSPYHPYVGSFYMGRHPLQPFNFTVCIDEIRKKIER
ncbi:hypothetical protein ElyMa_006467200 [Elysia marginata]|uniref:Uncharacterized protein n=1 Tax=Elysia marginata TaxID=1093978 RepID=A0AAV4HYN4_9GAST|nr:hypothetical protein ElyMa_006467200 [Elysia marginata]